MPRPLRTLPLILAAILAVLDNGVLSFQTSSVQKMSSSSSYASLQHRRIASARRQNSALHIFGSKQEEKVTSSSTAEPSAEETAEKYGLEAGLFQSLKSDNSGATAKSLLAKYGIAYLATSIPLAIISFAICYTLVDNGVDVAGLLAKVGINNVGDAGEKAGTFAIAYAAHKAASPIRFPPTVLLTPVVARLIGKEEVAVEEEGSD